MAYQSWKNTNFGKENFPEYRIGWQSRSGREYNRQLFSDVWTGTVRQREFVKNRSVDELYPQIDKWKKCTALLLSNLAHPEWVPVCCNTTLTTNVLCVQEKVEMIESPSSISQGCFKFHFIKNGTCLLFILGDKFRSAFKRRTIESRTRVLKGKIIARTWNMSFSSLTEIYSKDQFVYLLQAVGHFQRQETHILRYFSIFKSYSGQHPVGNNIYVCTGGSYVSSKYVCDDNIDCFDGSDEVHCTCINMIESPWCKFDNTSETGKVCTSLYFKSLTNQCKVYEKLFFSPELKETHKMTNRKSTFLCEKQQIHIDVRQIDDLVPDCGPTAEDECKLIDLLKSNKKVSCSHPGEIPCRKGHNRCFPLVLVCIFELDEHKNLFPCRTGEHLTDCTNFECHMKYKCPGFYCIPWFYVCDDKWDCPFGFDEEQPVSCTHHKNCEQLYKCKTSTICIHLGDVCDGETDCPLNEDEDMCSIHKIKCPQICTCLAFAIKCSHTNITFHTLPEKLLFMTISISYSNVVSVDELFRNIESVSFLFLSFNKISRICLIANELVHLQVFDLSNNVINQIQKIHCLSNLRNVKIIRLEKNKIVSVERHSFSYLSHLQLVNLSDNSLTYFNPNWITTKWQHKILLSVQNNPFQEIYTPSHDQAAILIETTDYRLCCFLPAVVDCHSLKPWYISCSNLLPHKSIQIVMTTVVWVLWLTNLVSLVCQVISVRINKRRKQGNVGMGKPTNCAECTILSINLSDMILGAYLFTIWVSSLIFHKTFFLIEKEWRSHVVCFLSFGLVLLFSFSSPVVLFFLCLMRFCAVRYAISSKFRETHVVIKCICFIFGATLLLSSGSTCITKLLSPILPFTLCLPFVDPSNSIIIFKCLVALITVFQFSASFFIAYLYKRLVNELKNRQSLPQHHKHKDREFGMIIQLVVITFSNILCWFPSGIVYITSLFLNRYPTDMVIWTTVAVLPINSILNPVVFAATTFRKLYPKTRKAPTQDGVSFPTTNKKS